MKWLNAPNSDEHVLCDDRGRNAGYTIVRDPVKCTYVAYVGADGFRKRTDVERLALAPVKRWCEEQYQAKNRREHAA